jgi:hypothetical protein
MTTAVDTALQGGCFRVGREAHRFPPSLAPDRFGGGKEIGAP